jgi:hypothetical protein
MAKYLERHKDEVNGRALCDLSAGTGLVGVQQTLHRCTNQCNWNLYVTLMLPLCGVVDPHVAPLRCGLLAGCFADALG